MQERGKIEKWFIATVVINFIVIPRRFAYSYVNRSVIDVYRSAHNGISATPYRKHELCLYSQVSTMRIHSCI